MAEDSKKIFALKQIRLEGRDEEAASGFIDEITLLQRLRGNSNIIQLIDAEVSNSSSSELLIHNESKPISFQKSTE